MPDFAGFIGDSYAPGSFTQDAQDLINWYVEVDPRKEPGQRGHMALYPTPGMRRKRNTGTGVNLGAPVRGLFNLPTTSTSYLSGFAAGVLVVVGTAVNMLTIASVDNIINASMGMSVIGTMLSSAGPVSITCNGRYVMITDGVDRYTLDLSILTFTRMTDGPWAGGVTCDIVDNFMVFNQQGTKQFAATSALQPTTPGLSFASSLSSFDQLVAIFVDQRQIALLGDQTSEFWANAGTSPFPFSISPGTTRQYGCAAPYTVARLGSGFAMLGKDQLGTNVVFYVVNYQFNRISTHAIEHSLAGVNVTGAYAFTYQIEGHNFYVLQIPSLPYTWVFDLATNMWHKRTSPTRGVNTGANYGRWRPTCATAVLGFIMVGDEKGHVYTLDNDYAREDDDNSVSNNVGLIMRTRRAPHIQQDMRYVYHQQLQLQFQPGVGLSSAIPSTAQPSGFAPYGPPGQNPVAWLRWSDDGGMTWGNYRELRLGQIGNYKARAIARRLGRSRQRVYEVSISDPVYAVLVSADIDVTVGAS